MEELLRSVFESTQFCDGIITDVEAYTDNAYIFTVDKDRSFLVCTPDGAEEILKEYRDAAINLAKQDLDPIYYPFFDFEGFGINMWQDLDDVYDNVTEVTKDEKLYYICGM